MEQADTIVHSDMGEHEAGLATDGRQFLTFSLGPESFGIEILRVQEIKGIAKITPIPNMPNFIKGVINLRGTVVPIVDLRTKFGMPQSEYNQFTVIIVVNIGEKVIGLVVDAVSDVLDLQENQIESSPEIGTDFDTSFIHGIAKNGERLITLLNMDQLIQFENFEAA